MQKILLEIKGLNFSNMQNGAYALILGEIEGNRRLPVIIGSFEAQAIAVELENMQPSRPLTHDLFRNFAIAFNIRIDEVVIYNLKEGIFFSKIICSSENGETREIDARTSDAIALAVRFNCPIYTFDFILSSAGMLLDESENVEDIKKPKALPLKNQETRSGAGESEFSSYSTEELKEILIKAIDDEAYETASRIRDELEKREKREKTKKK